MKLNDNGKQKYYYSPYKSNIYNIYICTSWYVCNENLSFGPGKGKKTTKNLKQCGLKKKYIR